VTEEFTDLPPADDDDDFTADAAPKAAALAAAGARYVYADTELSWLATTGSKHGRWIANFCPEVTEECTIYGSEGVESGAEYTLRCTQESARQDITIEREQLRSERTLYATIRDQVPRTFSFLTGRDIFAAANQFAAGEVLHSDRYSAWGWVQSPVGLGFISPGAGGILTVDGIKDSIAHSGFTDGTPERYKLYGKGMRPAESAEDYARSAEAFYDLLFAFPAQVMLTLIETILGSMLQSIGGLTSAPPLPHLFGKTGQLKTSLALIGLSLMGTFDAQGSTIPEAWTSTPTTWNHALHIARDHAMLFDDFKASMAKSLDVSRTVQNYADRTTRSRMTNEIKRRESLVPQAYLISTGEDRWEMEESVAARVLSIEIPTLQNGSNEWKARLGRVDTLQQHVRDGSLQLVGGTWGRWLARQGEPFLRTRITEERARQRRVFDLPFHARTVETVRTLRIIERLLTDCITEEYPSLAETWAVRCAESTQAQAEWLVTEAEEAQDLSPIRQLLTMQREALLTGNVQLQERGGTYGYSYGGGGLNLSAEVIGYFDEQGIYLTEYASWGWFERQHVRLGRRVLSYWRTACRDAKHELGAERVPAHWIGRGIHALRIPHEEAELLGVCERLNGMPFELYGRNFGYQAPEL